MNWNDQCHWSIDWAIFPSAPHKRDLIRMKEGRTGPSQAKIRALFSESSFYFQSARREPLFIHYSVLAQQKNTKTNRYSYSSWSSCAWPGWSHQTVAGSIFQEFSITFRYSSLHSLSHLPSFLLPSDGRSAAAGMGRYCIWVLLLKRREMSKWDEV